MAGNTYSDRARYGEIPEDVILRCSPVAVKVWAQLAVACDYKTGNVKATARWIAHNGGYSVRTVERAIAEIKTRTGRVVTDNAKEAGTARSFTLIFCRSDLIPAVRTAILRGMTPKAEGSATSVIPNYNVVNQLNSIPPTPTERTDKANDHGDGFAEYWKLYPVKLAEGRARREWALLTPEEKTSAASAVTILRTVYDAAADKQRSYTTHAHNWLREKRWSDQPEAIEQFYKVPGALRDSKRKAAPRQQVEPWLAGVKFQSGPPLTSGKKAS